LGITTSLARFGAQKLLLNKITGTIAISEGRNIFQNPLLQIVNVRVRTPRALRF